MSFTRANPLGWGLFEELTSAQMNALDIDHANAVDGVGGGAYSPSATIDFSVHGPRWMGSSHWPKLESRTITLPQPFIVRGVSSFNGATDGPYPGGGDWQFESTLVPDGRWLEQVFVHAASIPSVTLECVDIPDGVTLTAFGVWLYQPNATLGSLPSVVPKIQLHRWDPTNGSGVGTIVQLGERLDQSGSGSYHQNTHAIESTPISEAVNHASYRRYFLTVYGEGGTNSQNDLRLLGAYLKATIGEIRP